MQLQITAQTGEPVKKMDVSDQVFNADFNEGLVHQVVTAYLAKARQGSKAQLSRSDVSGGGKKPWRQKGTGRARAGTIRSPLWRKGGVTFAARPRSYEQKVNKKMYRHAFVGILSELVRQERIVVVDALTVEQPKTKTLLEKLDLIGYQSGQTTLIVTADLETNLMLSARNIPNLVMGLAANIDPMTLVASDKVFITVEALEKLQARFS